MSHSDNSDNLQQSPTFTEKIMKMKQQYKNRNESLTSKQNLTRNAFKMEIKHQRSQ